MTRGPNANMLTHRESFDDRQHRIASPNRIGWLTATAILLVTAFAGCGSSYPKRHPVSGVVKFKDGSPVKTGTVEFGIPGSQWTASGAIARDGTFSLSTVKPNDGAIAGEHKVIVRQIIVSYLPVQGQHDHGKLVDTRYADYRTTPLTLTVPVGGLKNVELIVDEKK